jgi:hypothetical protein
MKLQTSETEKDVGFLPVDPSVDGKWTPHELSHACSLAPSWGCEMFRLQNHPSSFQSPEYHLCDSASDRPRPGEVVSHL